MNNWIQSTFALTCLSTVVPTTVQRQRKQAQDSRKNHRNDRVAIHRSDIHASYELIDGIAYIVLPKIRFEESDCQLIANGTGLK